LYESSGISETMARQEDPLSRIGGGKKEGPLVGFESGQGKIRRKAEKINLDGLTKIIEKYP